MHPYHRSRRLLVTALPLLLACPVGRAQTPPYPDRTVRIVLPFPAGGSTDPVARMIAQKLARNWNQSVIVDNRPGANTIIGTEAVAKAPADGYTVLFTASTHVINPLLTANLPYDSVKDFTPVAMIVRSEFVLVVHPSVPAKTLREFIALAKEKPGALNYAISGNGNPNHLAGEYFGMVAGVKLFSVPYKGGGPAINDLLGGQVQAMFSVPTAVIQHVQSGKLRALAYTGSKPLPGLNVPTFAEAGLPKFEINSWNGLFVPAGTPKPIVEKLSGEVGRILAGQDVKDMFAAQAQEPFYLNAEQFAATLDADRRKYADIIKSADIKLQ